MSYQLYLDDECQECISYVRVCSKQSEWSCTICGLTEASYDDITWLCYQLQCGHYAHPRCYKKWCKQEKTVGCPQCGLLPYTEINMYCKCCNHFGHAFTQSCNR